MNKLNKIANDIRISLIKQRYLSGSGHLGGPLSLIEILTTLYFDIMKTNSTKPKSENRDRLILSGYQFPGLFATLYKKDFFNKEMFSELDKFNSKLKPNKNTPGFEISSYSSLGQGLSIANGIALGLKLKKNNENKVFVILGDGEMNEGQVWEALNTTINYNINNLIILINKNNLQNDDYTDKVKKIPLIKTLKGMGFEVKKVDGHNCNKISKKIKDLMNKKITKPKILICETIKGKGISFIEKNPFKYHACTLTKTEYEFAINELK